MQLRCNHCDEVVDVPVERITAELACPVCHQLIAVVGVEPSWTFRSLLREAAPTLGSTFFHTTLLLICALVTCDRRGGAGPDVVAAIGELPAESLNEPENEQLDDASVSEASDVDEMLLEIELVVADTAAVSTATLDQSLAQLMPSGASGGMLSDIGTPGGGSGTLGEGVSFMGVKAFGNRICVIADASGSMNGQKLEFVKEEILETIGSLSGSKRFQLLFFASSSVPYPHPGWRHPKSDLPLLEEFLNKKSASGGTNPTPAFRDAFELSPPPDVIYFMTDGLFVGNVVNEVAAMNTKRPKVQIHTISFMDKSAEALLMQIAEESGGSYNHVAGF